MQYRFQERADMAHCGGVEQARFVLYDRGNIPLPERGPDIPGLFLFTDQYADVAVPYRPLLTVLFNTIILIIYQVQDVCSHGARYIACRLRGRYHNAGLRRIPVQETPLGIGYR